MVDVLLLVGGAALVLLVIVDLLWTALWPAGGAGPLTSVASGAMWKLLRTATPAAGREGSRTHALRAVAGPVILLAVAVLWVLLLYAGWALIFATADGGVVSAATDAPASLGERLYFAGYSLFTLGNGDFKPVTGPWQTATVLVAANGLLLITLVITYLMPVVSAAATKRSLAGQITSFGADPSAFVTTAWGPHGFAAMGPQMASIVSTLGTLSAQHLAYPVLHYFHSRPAPHSIAVAVSVLDEAATLMRYGVAEHARPAPAVLAPARETVGSYLDTMASGYIPKGDHTPPPPDLGALRRAGIPVVDDAEFHAALAELAERRRVLLGLMTAEGWSWDRLA